jgi:AraC-like DNA-binding protein
MRTDILSDVLRQVHLTGALFFDVDACTPWVAEAPAAQEVAQVVMPGAQRVISYHVVVHGPCWVALADDASTARPVAPGSVILLPGGEPHVLSSARGMRGVLDLGILDQPRPDDIMAFLVPQTGDGPDSTRLICGFLGCDVLPFNPLLQALPRIMVVADGYAAPDDWLATLIRASVAEVAGARSAGRTVLSRLSELIFIEAVRRYADGLPDGASGWLAGLRHADLGRAITLLHQNPARAWTLKDLAREAGVSRTVLAERFTAHMGMPPMAYLANWRMQLAAALMDRPDATIVGIAYQVGYESEAAFSRAFKRCTGLSPAAWRSRRP